MIITTTNNVENKEVTAYKGIVFGEVITGINVLKISGQDFAMFLADVQKATRMNCLLHVKRP